MSSQSQSGSRNGGPLLGVKIVEFASLGPGPFAAMVLSDMGAEVVKIARTTSSASVRATDRGRRPVQLDLKRPEQRDLAMALAQRADILIEGYRPGVMERLGLGPETLHVRNPALIYGRVTGWGNHGPLADAPGHDINYIGLSGALGAIGTEEQPIVPLNLVGDYAAGAMILVAGVLAALVHARKTGEGQVIDAAMCDGAAYLMTPFYDMLAKGEWKDQRQSNWLDGGAHFYNTYRCRDGKWLSVGALEPQFLTVLLERTGAGEVSGDAQWDQTTWSTSRQALERIFASRTREEWCALLEGEDTCVAPVLSLKDAPLHPHNHARESFVSFEDGWLPSPAPRFSRTSPAMSLAPRRTEKIEQILDEWASQAT